MTAINNAQTEMRQKYMAYISAVAHGCRARKIKKMRLAALESISNSKYKTVDIRIYKGDNSLRKSSIDYIELCYRVFNEDYKHIVDMEEIAEQSFDEMQSYILLMEKTNEKLKLVFLIKPITILTATATRFCKTGKMQTKLFLISTCRIINSCFFVA